MCGQHLVGRYLSGHSPMLFTIVLLVIYCIVVLVNKLSLSLVSVETFSGSFESEGMVFIWSFNSKLDSRVRTILVLGYRVLGDFYFGCETRLPISAHAARCCLLSKPLSNSSWQRAAATIGLQRFASKQQWQGEWGGVGAPVERSPFMRDWKDYPLSATCRRLAL